MTAMVLGEFPSCVSDITLSTVAEAHRLPPAQFNLNLSPQHCAILDVIAFFLLTVDPFLEPLCRISLLRELPRSTPRFRVQCKILSRSIKRNTDNGNGIQHRRT